MSARGQTLFWLGLLAFFFLAIWLLSSILLPFVVGFAVAYFLDPAVDQLERYKVPRGLGTFIALVLFLLIVVLIFLLIVPVIQVQITEMIKRAPGIIVLAQHQFDRLTHVLQEHLDPSDLQRLREGVSAKIGDAVAWFGRVLQTLLTSSVALFSLLSLIFITPVVSFFLLRDWDRMIHTVDSWLPRRHVPVIREQARLVDESLSGFLRGQGSVCLATGTFYAAGLSLAGLDFGLVIGLVIGLLTWIPFLGTAIGAALSIGLAIGQFDSWAHVAVVAAIFVVGKVIEDNFLAPKLIGDRVNLHPVWVIFSLLAFGALFGFVGVLLAVPVAAILGVLVRFALRRYLASPLYDPDHAE